MKIPVLVSIIVPVFNRGELIRETVKSVEMQSFRNWELIIVDDGSTDNTVNVLKELASQDSRICVATRPDHRTKGANACRNHGLTIARGSFVKWMDSDDILAPESLVTQVELLTKNTQLVGVFGQSVYFDHFTGERQEPWSRQIYSDDILWDYVKNKIRWPIGGVLWRRDFFESLPFHEGLANSQEWLMHGLQLLRMSSTQYQIIPDLLYFVRRGNERMSSSRNAKYYYNQALARAKLLQAIGVGKFALKIRIELCKQIGIYLFHALNRALKPG